jgi:hypothetical protein
VQSQTSVQVKIPYASRDVFKSVHRDPRRFKVIVAARRTGKTVAAVNELVKEILSRSLPNPRGAFIAPTYTQAKEIAWNYVKFYTTGIPGVTYLEAELKCKLPNGGEIKLWGADAVDRLRGIYHDMVVIDEMAQMPPEIWPEIVRPTLMDREGKAWIIGTPKGQDAFYNLFRYAIKNEHEWGHYMFKASDTHLIPQKELDDAKSFMSPDQYAREFECSFEVASDRQFISLDECMACTERSRLGMGPIILGCDPARFGDDRTVVVIRNGDVIEEFWIKRGVNLMYTANQISEFATLYKPKLICVDGVGLGAGLVDRLQAMGYGNVIDVNSGRNATDKVRFGNFKAEIWQRMRNWIRDRAAFEYHKELFDDLTAVQYDFDKRDRLIIETKDSLRERNLPSPDLADALALTFAILTAPGDMAGYARAYMTECVPMIDPLADI